MHRKTCFSPTDFTKLCWTFAERSRNSRQASCRQRRFLTTFILAAATLFSAHSLVAAEVDPYLAIYLETLKNNGVTPTPAGAVDYLRELRPSGKRQAQIAQLIRQLGHVEFVQREAASNQLVRMPIVPTELLLAAAQGDDVEVRWRARLILDQSEAQSAQVLLAALKTITSNPPAESCDEIFDSLPHCRKAHLIDAARSALLAAVGPNDLDLCREKLKGEDPAPRAAAALAIAKLLPPDKLGELHPLLGDRDESVAIETAKALANLGDRASLAALVRLLDSTDPQIRSEAVLVLNALTGKQFSFASYDEPAKRAAGADEWKKWLAAEGSTAKLTFPIVRRTSARGDLRGNLLIATGSMNKVYEMDPAGKVVWSFAIDAWSAEKLSSGNVLIASYTANRLIEVDPAGKVAWEFGTLNAMKAKPLIDGNILVTDFGGHRVLEVNHKKAIVWEHKTPTECFDADRLPNGNTIFGCPNLVREVTPAGKTVNEWTISGRLNGFQALENGNILVANYGENKVVELTRDNKVVWELAEPQPNDVFRLPNGRMLISTGARVIEVGPDRKLLREITKSQYGSARQ